MTRRWFAIIATLALVLVFGAVNLGAHDLLRGVRIDLTDNRAFTLSDGTKETIDALAEPIDFTFFYSRDIAAERPDIRAYAERVRELLRAYSARAGDKIRLREIDPRAYSEDEDLAIAAGVEGLPTGGEDKLYFGLVGSNSVDERIVIPIFDWDREPFLEYELTRMVSRLDAPRTPKVAVISSLSLPVASGYVWREITRNFDATVLAPDFSTIPPDTDVLLVAHPAPLSMTQLFAIDQFVLAKGRALILVDPAAQSATVQGGFPASSLEPLLSRWGVELRPTAVMDRSMALPVETTDAEGRPAILPQPLYIRLSADALSKTDLVTGALARGVHVAAAGALSLANAPSGVEMRPLLQTSGQSMEINGGVAVAGVNPIDAVAAFRPSGRRFTVAGRLTGSLPSAFPNGAPAPEPSAATPVAAGPGALGPVAAKPGVQTNPPAPIAPKPVAPPAPLSASVRPANLVIVADADLLDDGFYVDPTTRTPVADNAAFVLNALDNLAGADALASLRARAPANRPLTRIESMRSEAAQRLVSEQAKLEQQLSEVEQRLEDLRARGAASGFFEGDLSAPLTPDEQAEVEKFRDLALSTRKALREVQGALRRDIDGLRASLVALNVWAMPSAVAAFGIFLVVGRRRRGGGV